MAHASRLAEEFVLWSSEEFGFVELPDSVCTGSSMMPQKKNPDPLELVRGKTGRIIGHVAGWLATMKGLPSGYNKDLQEDKHAVFDAEDELGATLDSLARVIDNLEIYPEATQAAATGLLLATDVADYLVARGLPFRQAHEVVGRMVRQLLLDQRDFSSLSLAEWRRYSELFDENVLTAITPDASVAARKTPQSTSPEAVATALREVFAWLGGIC